MPFLTANPTSKTKQPMSGVIITPIYKPAHPDQKILISPSTTCPGLITAALPNPAAALQDKANDDFFAWLLTNRDLIEWTEERDAKVPVHRDLLEFTLEDVVSKVKAKARELWGRELLLGKQTVRDLKVVKVSAEFEIREKDGAEEVVLVGGRRMVELGGV